MTTPVIHNADACRFEARVEGGVAQCCYSRSGSVLVLHHTEVPAALRGQGVAGELVAATLAWAREQRLRVRPVCSYVAVYMRRHPQTRDLLEA
ncbi:MAG: N-acetyltransferase [Burkholderiales bacterium]|nr:N-acetyltransferase [Burkholderiales bacterium]MDE1928909.1 N-acetyltransferase [Burkholderiales bacterium]MDE2160887.1 N-acetyltransferase [Burkholderiales bacterium]